MATEGGQRKLSFYTGEVGGQNAEANLLLQSRTWDTTQFINFSWRLIKQSKGAVGLAPCLAAR